MLKLASYLLSLVIVISAISAAAANQCIDLFINSQVPDQSQSLQKLLSDRSVSQGPRDFFQQHKLQELVWAMKNQGRPDIALAAQSLLKAILEVDAVISMSHSLGGSTEVYLVQFASGAQGVFKPRVEDWKIIDRIYGSAANYKAEIAASKLDLFLDTRIVPLTIERQIGDQRGSLQAYLPDSPTLQAYGFGHIFELQRMGEMVFFDILIGNPDRGARNILILKNQAVAIDNGRAFFPMPAGSPMASMFYAKTENSLKHYLSLDLLPFMNSIHPQLTPEHLHSVLSTELSPRQIMQIIDRYKYLQTAFEKKIPGHFKP